MSQENVDQFQESTEAFNRRDLAGWLAGYDLSIVFEPEVAQFEGAFTGHDGLRLFFTTIEDDFELFHVDFDDVRDLGDRVLALGSARARGKQSGIEGDRPVSVLATFRGGKCVHFKDFGTRASALEAAGLSE